MRHRPVRMLAIVAALATLVAVATAATTPSVAAARAPRGALVPLHGRGFCLGAGCVPLYGFGRGVSSIGNTSGSTAPTLGFAADGSLIVNGGFPPAVAILRRNANTGALRQPARALGCIGVRRPCARVRLPADGTEQLSGDKRSLYVNPDVTLPDRWVRYARNPRTGALRRIGRVSGCEAALQAPCPALHGIGTVATAIRAGRTEILLGSDQRSGGALAVLVRGAGGKWAQLSGSEGCVNADGAGGCAPLPCLAQGGALSLGALSDDGRNLYVIPASSDPESTTEGYLVSLARTGNGGLSVRGCVRTGTSPAAGYSPVWISTLPHSDAVLIAQITGNRGTGQGWGEFFASTPAPSGALGKPTPISGHDNLGPFPGSMALARDGRTAYAVDDENDLEVWRVTPHTAHQLPGRWGTPYRDASDGNVGASDVMISPDGRFAYVGTGSLDTSASSRGATVRAYRIVP